jgi:alpha-ketoglutarate-dependent taurine dioxygenase
LPVCDARGFKVGPSRRSHSTGFVGIDPDERERLVTELCDFAAGSFIYHHRWQVGDLLMWVELATMHRVAGDAPPQDRRVMLRTIERARIGGRLRLHNWQQGPILLRRA